MACAACRGRARCDADETTSHPCLDRNRLARGPVSRGDARGPRGGFPRARSHAGRARITASRAITTAMPRGACSRRCGRGCRCLPKPSPTPADGSPSPTLGRERAVRGRSATSGCAAPVCLFPGGGGLASGQVADRARAGPRGGRPGRRRPGRRRRLSDRRGRRLGSPATYGPPLATLVLRDTPRAPAPRFLAPSTSAEHGWPPPARKAARRGGRPRGCRRTGHGRASRRRPRSAAAAST